MGIFISHPVSAEANICPHRYWSQAEISCDLPSGSVLSWADSGCVIPLGRYWSWADMECGMKILDNTLYKILEYLC